MIKYKNECVGCKDLGIPCMGNSCPHKNVVHHYCDECEEECKLYHYDNGEYCRECIIDRLFDVLDVVDGTE